MNIPDASVIIGFRDWGADRIRRSALSVMNSFGSYSGEVIISDYGSKDPGPAHQVAEEIGAKYVYTAGDPVWSASRALNAGFAIADGTLLVSTDADMLFLPGSFERIIETAREAEDCALFLQCRDLPPSMGDEYFETTSVNWDLLEQVGRLRPRWGIGGLMTISRQGYLKIRGLDERLHTYGGEDLDIAQRARRAGYRTVWIEDPNVRMYHMWHPPTMRIVEKSEAAKAAVDFNRNVLYHDKTITRNVVQWRHRPEWATPLVTVSIATRDRPSYLIEAIQSVLAQTVQDFEIVVVDDGSETDIKSVVEMFDDARIRYFRQDAAGISAARNLALDNSRGFYTAVMDDDDLMPPQRLEWQLESVTVGHVGSAGSFVNFDDGSGDLHLIVSKIPSIAQAAEKGGAPGHGTWLIQTDVMRLLRYDESISSGIDNNFFLRLLRCGYKISHCGRPVLIRRQHSGQVTLTDAPNQSDAARQSVQFFQFNLTPWHKNKLAEEAKLNAYPKIGDREDFQESARPYLPDHLVKREAWVEPAGEIGALPDFDGSVELRQVFRGSSLLRSILCVSNATYADMGKLAKLGRNLQATVYDPASTNTEPWLDIVVDDYLGAHPDIETFVISRREGDGPVDDTSEGSYSRKSHIGLDRVSLKASFAGVDINSDAWIICGVSAERLLS